MNPIKKELILDVLEDHLAYLLVLIVPVISAIGIYHHGNVTSVGYMIIGILSFVFGIMFITYLYIIIHDLYVLIYNALLDWVIKISNEVSIKNDYKKTKIIYETYKKEESNASNND